MSKLTKALTAAAGNAGGDNLYVEDVFSTYLYDGTGTTNNIVNGVDLTEGGLVWIKTRDDVEDHNLVDSERGSNKGLESNTTDAETGSAGFSTFNSNGFTLTGGFGKTNSTSSTYASWTFRKAEKFFDVQTYSGNDVNGRQIAHNLGSTPGLIIIKNLDNSNRWYVWHESFANDDYLFLNETFAKNVGGTFAYLTADPTSTTITIARDGSVNYAGYNYVMYLFASDAGGFGDDGDENIIKCGSVTTDGSGDATVTLGFEPQWVMLKRTDGAGTWAILDTMRGYDHSSSKRLMPNVADAEENYTGTNILGVPTATGFTTSGPVLDANSDYIYIAIRRPMKTPESGTEVFLASTVASGVQIATGFNVDLWINGSKDGSAGVSSQLTMDRMRGAKYLRTTQTTAETSTNNPFTTGPSNTFTNITQGGAGVAWMFKRATGFMDVVAYTGTNGTISRNHNLGVAPELMITKRRDSASAWTVLSELDGSSYSEMGLNSTIDKSTRTYASNQYLTAQPTATVFAQAASYDNESGGTYITYLFATLAGVSKVGSYTGTGSNVDVDCGFSAGARFILIKRTDSSGDWYVWDSVRGITAGNDPYLLLNSTAAEVTNTDYIDPLSSGFTVTSSAPAALNASGGNYIFLAIA